MIRNQRGYCKRREHALDAAAEGRAFEMAVLPGGTGGAVMTVIAGASSRKIACAHNDFGLPEVV
jgi:hypothetical protein